MCEPSPVMGEGRDRVCASLVRQWVRVGRGSRWPHSKKIIIKSENVKDASFERHR